MPLSATLQSRAEPIWSDQHSHPFVTGIADGTLPIERFRFYLEQDYLYLIDYCRLFALCAAKSSDLEMMTAFSRLLTDTLTIEMDLHRTYCASFGIDVSTLEQIVKAPTCQAYTDFLIATAANGDVLDALAALLPCAWGYRDVGQSIAAGGIAAGNPYREWVEMYAGAEYSDFVDWCIATTDRLGEGLPEWRVDRLAAIFNVSTRYEAAFWEMSWSQQTW